MGLNGFNSDGENSSLFAEINVTPLVDVMLVLLIIFMVTAPFMIETIGVDLPKAEGGKAQGLTTPLTVSIDRDEAIKIAGQTFSLEQLKVFLSESPRIKNGEAVFIEADKSIRHGTLMLVMSTLHTSGASKINIMMEQP